MGEALMVRRGSYSNEVLNTTFEPIEKTLLYTNGDTKAYAVASVAGVDLNKFNYAFIGDISSVSTSLFGCFYDLKENKALFSLQGTTGAPVGSNIMGTLRNYSLYYGAELFNNQLYMVMYCSITNNGEKYMDSYDISDTNVTFM